MYKGQGQLVAATGRSQYQLNPDKPSALQFRQARTQRAITWTEGLDDAVPGAPAKAQIKALGLVATPTPGLLAGPRCFLANPPAPPNPLAVPRNESRGPCSRRCRASQLPTR